MKKSIKTFLHVGFWFFYLMLLSFIMYVLCVTNVISDEEPMYNLAFLAGIAITPPIFSFYAYYKILFPRFLQQRKLPKAFLFSAILSSIAVLLGMFTIWLMSSSAFECIKTGYREASILIFILSTIFGLVALILKGFLTWYEELKVKEALLQKNHDMELALIKSQLDPHFLFNTINNIDVLIIKNKDEASAYLNKLSDIMRFMLYETKSDDIPLTKEIEYIKKYIELQKIRTTNEHYVHFEIIGEPKNIRIAPMLFIPFIENAFKHTSNKKVDHAIDIKIKIDDESINFECQNKINPVKMNKNISGLGNDLIHKRIQLLYPNRHSLQVHKNEELYSVSLKIDHEAT